MSNGKVEMAIAILNTASGLHSIEDARELIEKACLHLRDEPDFVPAMALTRDMIYSAVDRLATNMPSYEDEEGVRASKIHICESALLQIVEYAKAGLAARKLGSQEIAEKILAGKTQRSLEDFAEVPAMKAFLKENNATMEVRLAGDRE